LLAKITVAGNKKGLTDTPNNPACLLRAR